MWFSILLLALSCAPVSAHTLFTNFYVDGVDQGDGTCVRMPAHANNATFPQPDITGADMACGLNGETAVARTCGVQRGSSVSFEFRSWPDASQPGSIDKSHKGPCAVYMKKVDDATVNGTAAGDGWFKVFGQDYDNQTSQWCTEKLIANDGRLTVDLPADLAGGDYLLRPELLALHQADKNPPDPQFFVGCAQVFLNTTGSAKPRETTSIPGYVNLSMPAMTFNIWKEHMDLPYPFYGPPVYQSSNKTASELSSKQQPALVQTTGLKPDGCILTVSSWCGLELDSYSTQDGCWNASKACYAQESVCWGSAGPTGGAKCKIWEQKCKSIQDGCAAKNFNGPPNSGKILDPPLRQIQLPPAYENSEAVAETSAQADDGRSPAPSQPNQVATTSTATVKTTETTMAVPVVGLSNNACGARNSSMACAKGMCCSSHGYCGSSDEYCGDGCQAAFGVCGVARYKARPRTLRWGRRKA